MPFILIPKGTLVLDQQSNPNKFSPLIADHYVNRAHIRTFATYERNANPGDATDVGTKIPVLDIMLSPAQSRQNDGIVISGTSPKTAPTARDLLAACKNADAKGVATLTHAHKE